jgi:hypothetical protein
MIKSKKEIYIEEKIKKLDDISINLKESFENLLKSLKINEYETQTILDGTKTNFTTSQIINSSEELINLTNSIKDYYIYEDLNRLNLISNKNKNIYQEKNTKIKKILNDIKQDIDISLIELEYFMLNKKNF